jgi:hypothetical protein
MDSRIPVRYARLPVGVTSDAMPGDLFQCRHKSLLPEHLLGRGVRQAPPKMKYNWEAAPTSLNPVRQGPLSCGAVRNQHEGRRWILCL